MTKWILVFLMIAPLAFGATQVVEKVDEKHFRIIATGDPVNIDELKEEKQNIIDDRDNHISAYDREIAIRDVLIAEALKVGVK